MYIDYITHCLQHLVFIIVSVLPLIQRIAELEEERLLLEEKVSEQAEEILQLTQQQSKVCPVISLGGGVTVHQ